MRRIVALFLWTALGLAGIAPEAVGAVATLRGKALKPNGDPINGAVVEYLVGESLGSATTGADGKYEFTKESDQAVRFWVRARKPHEYLPSRPALVVVQSGATADRDLELTAGHYSIKPIGPTEVDGAPAIYGLARRLNDLGQAIGHVRVKPAAGPAGPERPFVYEKDSYELLPLLPGGTSPFPSSINYSGHIVGGVYKAYHYTPLGELRDLSDRTILSAAKGISDFGDIVGHFRTRGGPRGSLFRAGRYDPEAPAGQRWVALPIPGEITSSATDVSNRGNIVGYHAGPNRENRVFFYSYAFDSLWDFLEGQDGSAYAINNRQEIVGSLQGRPFYYNFETGTIRLAVPPGAMVSSAYDISDNTSPAIIGVAQVAGLAFRGVLWDLPGFPLLLDELLSPTSGWALENATGVNSSGQIVGHGRLNKMQRAYLLSPPAPGNLPPKGRCQAKPAWTTPGAVVSFDASDSEDQDGAIVSYVWDFGDGSTGQGKSVEHAYSETGTYTAVVTVYDECGDSDSSWVEIVVQASSGKNVAPFVLAAAELAPEERGRVDLKDAEDVELVTGKLIGYVNDDGLPKPLQLVRTTWEQIKGPAVSTIADRSALETLVALPEWGIYVFRLTADDGELSTSAEVELRVGTEDDKEPIGYGPGR